MHQLYLAVKCLALDTLVHLLLSCFVLVINVVLCCSCVSKFAPSGLVCCQYQHIVLMFVRMNSNNGNIHDPMCYQQCSKSLYMYWDCKSNDCVILADSIKVQNHLNKQLHPSTNLQSGCFSFVLVQSPKILMSK